LIEHQHCHQRIIAKTQTELSFDPVMEIGCVLAIRSEAASATGKRTS
jgi:hypothetical protein